ncbi:MAG TPA: bifunctional diaminohydroxyphosphoribosylaminopyrimidine deaminase/5-amino-6-(5-phosphoribosylamino)uracil reductase RibD [Blastocatellia bacterium]|nr:bifunctional diaminohydroxyphosphoribosylaminopyrimidine deaminase/5-amino-6-(5-phosphoribosylamino)uracil reductase RibD [Blastocatellia bacterium]
MRDDDLAFMKRALELAGRGAGLVSPNPMVGAVLVNEGEVVGEGFHRYDRLKHAESYAIALAGDRARGATLYCTLEPCCHYGRTPPCTGALIEAGISRAVIAMVDPDPRVNGSGIGQMRAAGIEVDVGLCEPEARRLNEFYLKRVTRGIPFVHALLVYEAGGAGGWKPSDSFLAKASEYDAIILGSEPSLNRLFAGNSLDRERHRPLILAGDRATLDGLELPEGARDSTILELWTCESDSAPPAETPGLSKAVGPESTSILLWLARLQAASVLVLPGGFSPRNSEDFEVVDKVTALTPSGSNGTEEDLDPVRLVGDLRLEGVNVERASGHSEISGYLRLTGSAREL